MSESSPFAAVILAAGKGTRMKSDLPKVMHHVAGKPMIRQVIATADALKPEKLVVVIAPGMESVQKAALAENSAATFAVQSEQLGTGHAVRMAEAELRDYAGPVLILYGDTPLITRETLAKMLEKLTSPAKPSIVVLGMRPDDPAEYGRLILGSGGELEAIVEYRDASDEEKKTNLCNSGVMAVAGAQLFPLLAKLSNKNAKNEYYLTDIIALTRKNGGRCAVVEAPEEELLGVNSRSELAKAEAILQTRLRTRAMENGATLIAPETVYFSADTQLGRDVVIHPFVVFSNGVKLGNHVEIRSYSHIDGASVGDHSIIGPFARLRPGAQLEEHVHIGNFVEIKKSYVAKAAKINHLSYIGDAAVGEKANIGAGTITCNYDGVEKYVTEIGAGAFIGSNSALVAPVAIGAGAVVGAGSVITEDVEAEALAFTRPEQIHKPGWTKRKRTPKRVKQ